MTEIEKAIKTLKDKSQYIGIDYSQGKDVTVIILTEKQAEEALKALEKQIKINSTLHSLEEIVARNIIAWETSKDKSQGLLPEIYLIDRALFTQLTGLEPTIPNLKKYMTY